MENRDKTPVNVPAGAVPASPASSSTSSTGRQPYVSQFTPSTHMIITHLKNRPPGTLSQALTPALSTVDRITQTPEFEETKRRLVMNLNMSMTMPMPMPMPRQPSKGPSPITQPSPQLQYPPQYLPQQPRPAHRNPPAISMPAAFQLRTPAPIPSSSTMAMPMPSLRQPAPAAPNPVKSAAPKVTTASKTKGKEVRGAKRKRAKNDDGASSSLTDPSDSDFEPSNKNVTPTMTKSGRQVQKPTQFNPTEVAGSKRKHYGKRTPEQALCRVCTRGLSPNKNQIVFCDGCNSCWHQMCHDPYIEDDYVSDESLSWFCRGCLAKREKALAKKKTMDGFKGASWAHKTTQQKRSYLTDLPHAHLVNVILYCTELHPDLPIFPGQEPAGAARHGSQGLFSTVPVTAGQSPRQTSRTGAKITGPAEFPGIDTSSATPTSKGRPNGKSRGKTQAAIEVQGPAQADRESSVDSIPPSWPKVGQGMLMGVELDEDDLRDGDDYEAFSVTTYDNKGRKIMENGMPV
ncbi:hypothetical protein F5Y16DRAFT_186168 [Xylariaceae sp. FL0255]|nr:hypothetical protein F5Y16DRAFT_186168 [Xylariaceae sp. FL0255]